MVPIYVFLLLLCMWFALHALEKLGETHRDFYSLPDTFILKKHRRELCGRAGWWSIALITFSALLGVFGALLFSCR